jgi:pimeloyl-ACP methyl ester carboxylesterase
VEGISLKDEKITFDVRKLTNLKFEDTELIIKNNSIKISDFNSNNLISELPYSHTVQIYKIDYEVEMVFNRPNFKIEVIMENDQYCYAIQEHYLELYTSEEIPHDKLLYLTSPRVEITNIKEHKCDQRIASLTSQQINYINHYSQKDLQRINRYLTSMSSNKLIDTLRKFNNITKKSFLLIISKLIKPKPSVIESGLFYIDSQTNEQSDDQEEQKRNIAIIVHGLASRIGEPYKNLTNYLVSKGLEVYGFDYYTVNEEILDNGVLLANEIKKLKRENSNIDKIFIVAHSMGGLVSRSALVFEKAPVDGIVMAGTPNEGSIYTALPMLVRTIFMLGAFSKLLPIKQKDLEDIVLGRVEGLKQLTSRSSFINTLGSFENISTQKKYFGLAGNYRHVLFSDTIVAVHNALYINGINIPNVIENWSHFSYFSQEDLNNSVGLALDYLE